MILGKKKEDQFFTLFKEFADIVDKMGTDFGEIINNYHNVERTIADMKMTESECDAKSHVILEILNESFITPFDREDIFKIVNQLDDLADYMEDTARKLIRLRSSSGRISTKTWKTHWMPVSIWQIR